jgi:CBS domain-containing protein
MEEEEATVAQLMESKVQTVDLNANVKECAKVMAKRGATSAVVVADGSAIGIVTEKDLVMKVMADNLDPAKVLVRDIMSTPLITIEPERTVTDAAKLMAQYKVRRLVVIDRGTIAGIVSSSDITKSLAKRSGYEEATLEAIAKTGEGPDSPYR